MRIDTDLREEDRKAVKAYADANNLTMKGAYTRLLRDGFWSRTALAYFPEADNYGVRWLGYDSRIRTNIDPDKIDRVLRENPDQFHYLYMPRRFALEEAGIDVNTGPGIFDVELDDEPPRTDDGPREYDR